MKAAEKKNKVMATAKANKIPYANAVVFDTSGLLMMLISYDKENPGENKVSR
jgi:hypothetical protein